MAELNEFEAPIPGQSLAGSELGTHAWENPPDFPHPDDAFEYIFTKISQDDGILMGITKLLESDVTPDTIADGILLNAFMVGQITPDVSIILREPLIDLIRVVGKEAEVEITEVDTETARLTASVGQEIMEELSEIPTEAEQPEDEEKEEEQEPAPRGMMAPLEMEPEE